MYANGIGEGEEDEGELSTKGQVQTAQLVEVEREGGRWEKCSKYWEIVQRMKGV